MSESASVWPNLMPSAQHLIESWAMHQIEGRLASAGLKARADEDEDLDEGLRRWLHVETFWDQDRNWQFRSMALEVFGKHAPLEQWVWYVPWEPKYRSCLRLGWGWVRNHDNPLVEVWKAFVEAFTDWHLANPMPSLAVSTDTQKRVRKPVRLVSVRTACDLLNAELATVREWCRRVRFRGAIKYGDWAIPLNEVVSFKLPRRGRPPKVKPMD